MPEYLDGNMEVINQPAPALSATSDMPVVAAPPAADPPADPPAGDPPADPPVADPPADPPDAAPVKEPKGVGKALKERDDLIAAERKRADDTAELLRKATEALAKLTEKPVETKPDEVAPRPKRENFSDPDAYEDALIEWSGNRAAAVAQKKLETDQAASAAQKALDDKAAADKQASDAAEAQYKEINGKFMQRVETAKEQWPDFDQVVQASYETENGPMVTPTMFYTIQQLENGPAIAYHLGKNRAESERIGALHPNMQIAEIGRLAALVAGPKAAAPKPRPPAPITPLDTNRGKADAAPSLTDMPTESYVEARLKEMGSAAATRH